MLLPSRAKPALVASRDARAAPHPTTPHPNTPHHPTALARNPLSACVCRGPAPVCPRGQERIAGRHAGARRDAGAAGATHASRAGTGRNASRGRCRSAPCSNDQVLSAYAWDSGAPTTLLYKTTILQHYCSIDQVLSAYVWDSEATLHYRLPAASLAAGRFYTGSKALAASCIEVAVMHQ